MTDKPFYVYAIYRPDGTPCYIGKGKGMRWRHNGKYGRNGHFINIMAQAKAQGLKLPREKLVENLTEQQALSLEAFFIAAIGREAHGGPLVNLTNGGEVGPSGFKWTPELNARNPRNRGKSHSAESRAQTSAALKDRPKSASHVANAARALTGGHKSTGWWSTEEGRAKQRANNRGNTGKKYSDEARRKIRDASIRQQARIAVKTSPTWAQMNSVRFSQAA